MAKLLIVAGEASGDLHGGKVVAELKKKRPDIELIGTGGRVLESAGTRLYYRVEEMAVIGFWEVAKRYGYYKGIFDTIVRKLDEERPDAVFLVDYPAFNLKVAKEAKLRGIRVLYYIAPQVWAWKKKRIRKIKAFVDELICLFPFEVAFFKREGMDAHCFGHPLVETAVPTLTKSEVCTKWGLDGNKRLISLLPGSRRNEILKHLPLLLKVAEILGGKFPDLQFAIPLAPTVRREELREGLSRSSVAVHLVGNDTYNIVGHADFALVASGTATLETALLGTPMLIYYRVSAATYAIGKYLLGIETVGLPNIVAGREIVPEMIRHFTSAEDLANVAERYLANPEEYLCVKRNLADLRDKLGEKGAYRKTAEFLNALL